MTSTFPNRLPSDLDAADAPLQQATNMRLIRGVGATVQLRGKAKSGLNDCQGAIVGAQDHASHPLVPRSSGGRFRVILKVRTFLRRELLPDGPVQIGRAHV